jgi:ABC-type dipeptide/oligopeptide/nickel transport system permease subunit
MTDTAPVTLGAGLDAELAGLEPPRRRGAVIGSLVRSPIGLIGLTIVLGTVFVALFGSLIWTIEPDAIDATRLEPPSAAHPMGTDELGRDTLARVIAGAGVSLQVGLVAVGVAAVLGVPLGLFAAFYGRWVDVAAMRFVDILFAIPALVLAIVVAGLLGPSRTNAMLAIGIAYAPAFARVARSSALSVMAQPYIEAARSLGTSSLSSMRRHLLPNITAPLIVMASTYLGTAILSEAALSFLGLGVQPPEPSWGGMLSTARTYMLLSPWVAIFPGAAIMLVVLGMNLLGDALRDTLDPRLRRR